MADLRARLQAIADGRAEAPEKGAVPPVQPTFVHTHQATFRAWHRFAVLRQGEPLTAPAGLLTPLP